ncbi:MAG: flippase [Candidatus Marinimicrobia bacterium]|nr:flippase [Candidatus Neomarinimicrobiota bacterium]
MNEVNSALQKIAKGAGLVFIGTIISNVLGFIGRIIMARYLPVTEYGIFNLALTVLGITLTLVVFGIPQLLSREIAYYIDNSPSNLEKIISTTVIITMVSSLIGMVVLVGGANKISSLFDGKMLAEGLRIVALSLPFSALTSIIISISRGFGRVWEKVYFQNIIYPLTWLIIVAFLSTFKFPSVLIFWGYVLFQCLAFVFLILHIKKMHLFNFRFSLDVEIAKRVTVSAIPLLFSGILGLLLGWIDVLMLGYYKTSTEVAIYNVSSTFARLLQMVSSSVGFLYLPTFSYFYINNKTPEMKKIYQIITKWTFLVMFPLFLGIMTFPKLLITLFFGKEYALADRSLQILSLRFLLPAIFGFNWLSLIAIGAQRFLVYSTAISIGVNVFLNSLLIPPYGVEGAAFATVTSQILANLLNSFKLYKELKLHPFSGKFIRLLVISVGLLVGSHSLSLNTLTIWNVIIIMSIFLGIHFILVLVSRSLDEEDFLMFLLVEKKTGINLKIIEAILKRFIHK